MFTDTVTIFHYHNGFWLPFTVHGAELQYSSAAKSENSGASSDDGALLFIPICNDRIGEYTYVLPEDFNGEEGYITFADGDFFVQGICTGSVSDDDYTDGYYAYMNERSSECFRIVSVKRFKLIPHFEIGGA